MPPKAFDRLSAVDEADLSQVQLVLATLLDGQVLMYSAGGNVSMM